MYTISLKSCFAKIERAEEHRQALENYIQAVFEDKRNSATLRADLDGETGYHIVSLQTVPDLSSVQENVGTQVGDVIHNLRSALDHLAWQLACHKTGGNPAYPRRIQFAIEDDPNVFRRRCTPSVRDNGAWLGEIDSAHHTIIQRYQPYQGLNYGLSQQWFGGYIHELALLRDISDTDKHRVLTTVLVPTTVFEHYFRVPYDSRLGPMFDWDFATDHTLETGAKVMRAQLLPGPALTEIETHMDMVGYARPTIALDYAGPVVAEMNRITIFVVKIIHEFEKFS